jgi:peroxisomal enoyl-CoA hydratase 2
MSGPGVGFEYPSVPVSWYKRDVLLFANAIGCDAKDELHFLYVCVIRLSGIDQRTMLIYWAGISS